MTWPLWYPTAPAHKPCYCYWHTLPDLLICRDFWSVSENFGIRTVHRGHSFGNKRPYVIQWTLWHSPFYHHQRTTMVTVRSDNPFWCEQHPRIHSSGPAASKPSLPKPVQRTEKPPVCRVFSCLLVPTACSPSEHTHWSVRIPTGWKPFRLEVSRMDRRDFRPPTLSNPAAFVRNSQLLPRSDWRDCFFSPRTSEITAFPYIPLCSRRSDKWENISVRVDVAVIYAAVSHKSFDLWGQFWKGSSLNLKSKLPSIFHPTVKLSICCEEDGD